MLIAPGVGLFIDGLLLAVYGWRLASPRPFVVTLNTFTQGTQVFGLILLVPIALEAWSNASQDPSGLLRLIAYAVGAAAALFVLVAQLPLARGRGRDLLVLNIDRPQVHDGIARALSGLEFREEHGTYHVGNDRVDVRMGATLGAAVRISFDGPGAVRLQGMVREGLVASVGTRRLLGIAEGGLGVVMAAAGAALFLIGLN